MKMDILSKMVMIYQKPHSNGQLIQIKVLQPEYITETFNMHSDTNNDSIIFTGDDE